MHILNFSHPFTEAQLQEIRELVHPQQIVKIHWIPVQFDTKEPFVLQVEALLAGLPLSNLELQSLPILLNLPSFNVIAAILLTALHGRIGYFPGIIRLRPVLNQTAPIFEVAEIINLQSLRDQNREERWQ